MVPGLYRRRWKFDANERSRLIQKHKPPHAYPKESVSLCHFLVDVVSCCSVGFTGLHPLSRPFARQMRLLSAVFSYDSNTELKIWERVGANLARLLSIRFYKRQMRRQLAKTGQYAPFVLLAWVRNKLKVCSSKSINAIQGAACADKGWQADFLLQKMTPIPK